MAATLTWNDLDLVSRLGEGQAGEVWTARLRRPFREYAEGDLVAVKRYKRWVLDQPGQLERVFRELATGTRLSHPNVVNSHCLVTTNDGLPALVMHYYDGVSLETVLAQHRKQNLLITPNDAFRLLRGIAGGVRAIHETGALHRDVKPANVIVQPDGTPVLMDLGVVTETLLPEHTRTERFLGTIRYAHPEYLTGQRCAPEIDAYSVGGIAYELLFGGQFLGEEGNWASLVARVVAWRTPMSEDVARECEMLTELHSHEVAEAAYWVVRHLIWKPTSTTLQAFCDAIDGGFWKQPFFESGQEVKIGIPHDVAWEAVSRRSPYLFWRESLPSVWEHLVTRTQASDRADLARLLRSRYWEWRCKLDDDDIDDVADIDGDLGFFFDIFDTDEDDLRPFTDTLLMLYRYGFFTDTTQQT